MTDFILNMSRAQFALTSIFHYFYVPLTLGLVWFVAIFECIYVKTKDEKYKKLTKFWGNLFIINFALGVATGIVQEFQFGMNWSEYSRFVGDIFGIPLAIEALATFFLESTFIGLWLYSWDKVSPKLHALFIILVAIGSNMSAYWIIVANSWMQSPVGFEVINGQAKLVDFMTVLGNPYFWKQFPHLLTSAYATGSFFVLGVSAIWLLRDKTNEIFRTSFRFAAVLALITSLATGMMGHTAAQHVAKAQPMKMAAMEALWDTTDPAALSVFAIFDENERKDVFNIKVPYALSFLIHGQRQGEVKGINQVEEELIAKHGEGDYVPPVLLSYLSFRVMVGIGTFMIILGLITVFYARSKDFQAPVWLLKTLSYFIVAPFIAGSAGWILAEVGRYPWLVYEQLSISKGVTPSMDNTSIIISFIGFNFIYVIATFILIHLLRKHINKGIIN